MEVPLKQLTPLWMKDKATGKTVGFFFVCPVCPQTFLGLCPHPILVYTDETFALAYGREAWTMNGKSFDTLSILGNLKVPNCKFTGWISKGIVRWLDGTKATNAF